MANTLKLPTRDVVDQRRQRFSGKYQNQDMADGYSVGTFEYPQDLRVDPDKQHYVAFYILTREKSQAGTLAKRGNQIIEPGSDTDISRTERNLGNRLDLTSGTALNFITNNAGTLAALAYVLKDWKDPTRIPVGAGIGLATDKIIDETSSYMRKTGTAEDLWKLGNTVRLKEVITLHTEEKPSVRYSVNYANKDLGAITGALVQGSAAGLSKGKEFLGEAFARAIAELIKLPSIVGNTTLADVRELATASRTNPFRQVMFESVDYRTFNFRYNFFPKSIKESDRVRAIIQLFKTHMHPELSENKFFHIYPSEFEIRYMYKTKENEYLHKLSTCALTDMQVDYGGDQFATFENGAPVQIGLTLTFRELEQMDSKRIKNGF